ncbi:MAG TPA: hypothetical protein VF283_00360 [Bryobacteraceae bacterium]
MRPQDKIVFLEAARLFQSWILVRRTNVASLAYIGKKGYISKAIHCKAKTADSDAPPYTVAGLVVHPEVHSGVFRTEKKKAEAKKCWKAVEPLIGKTFVVDENKQSRHYGCLIEQGNYIHGDYDLYDMIDITQPSVNVPESEILLGQPNRFDPRFPALQSFVNFAIGVPMLQHGGQAQYADHSEEPVDAFGPHGEETILLNKFTTLAWYKQKFGDRKPAIVKH